MSPDDKAKAYCERIARQLKADGATVHQIALLFRLLRTDPPDHCVRVMCLTDMLFVRANIRSTTTDDLPYPMLARVLRIHMIWRKSDKGE